MPIESTKKIKKISVYNGQAWDSVYMPEQTTIDNIEYTDDHYYYEGTNIIDTFNNFFGRDSDKLTPGIAIIDDDYTLTSGGDYSQLPFKNSNNTFTGNTNTFENALKVGTVDTRNVQITNGSISTTGTITANGNIYGQAGASFSGPVGIGTANDPENFSLNGSTYTALQKPIKRTTRQFSKTITSVGSLSVTEVSVSLPTGSTLPNNIISRSVAGFGCGGGKCTIVDLPNFDLNAVQGTTYVTNVTNSTASNVPVKVVYEYLYTD